MRLIKILFIGDIFGRVGRNIVFSALPNIKKQYGINFVIANNENATHGHGCNLNHYKQLSEVGINCFTSGNHFMGCPVPSEDLVPNQIRPLNLPYTYPLSGSKVFNYNGIKIRVTNLIGNSYIQMGQDNVFTSFENFLKNNNENLIHIVDLHAEATGEKRAFAEMFDSKVSAIIGTHTHVPTADEKVLLKGTAFITDVGCCGAVDSVLGADKKAMIYRSAYGMKTKIENIEHGLAEFNAVVITIDADTNLATNIERINYKERV